MGSGRTDLGSLDERVFFRTLEGSGTSPVDRGLARLGSFGVAAFVLGVGGWAALGESGWKVRFAENPELPPGFKQLELPRADESTMVAFLGSFGSSFDRKKPVFIYLEGSGAQSRFVRVGERVGYSIFGLLAQEFGLRYHVATIEKRGVGFGQSSPQPGSAMGATLEYQKHATLSDRVADVRLLIDRFANEDRVDGTRLVTFG